MVYGALLSQIIPHADFSHFFVKLQQVSIRLKKVGQQTAPHYVVKFFDQYQELCDSLAALNVGEGMTINIEAPFPPRHTKSWIGMTLTEAQLQHRWDVYTVRMPYSKIDGSF